MDYKITFSEKHFDERGYLVEFLKRPEMPDAMHAFGQIYFVTFERRDAIRGNHFHRHTHEWFGIAHGRLEVILEDVQTKERLNLILDSADKKFVRLYIGPNVAHAFRCLSESAVMLDYTNRLYDRGETDRNAYILMTPP